MSMVEAVLLAAGEGRRLKPITDHYPKPLLPIVSAPLLEHILLSLKEQGIGKVCINVCHLKERIIGYLEENDPGVEIALSEEEQVLGTGGGIGRMRGYIEGVDFIVHNGDIVTNIQFAPALAFHRSKKAMATLIVEEREGTRDVMLGRGGCIEDIGGRLGRHGAVFGFTGIAVLNRRVFDYLPSAAFADLVDTYAEMLRQGEALFGFKSRDHYWLDIGTKERYLLVHKHILVDGIRPFKGIPRTETPVYLGEKSRVGAKARLSGFVSIGADCSIQNRIGLENCVLFDGTQLRDEATYHGKVIAPEFVV